MHVENSQLCPSITYAYAYEEEYVVRQNNYGQPENSFELQTILTTQTLARRYRIYFSLYMSFT